MSDVLDRTRVDTKVRSVGSRQTERLNLVGDGRSKERSASAQGQSIQVGRSQALRLT